MDTITLKKPLIGEPCNGCGICCHIQLCNTGAFLLKKSKTFGQKIVKGKCPALLSNKDGSFSCGFIVSPKRFMKSKYSSEVISRTVAQLVGSGNGCDDLGYDDENPIENMKLDKMVDSKMRDNEWKEKQVKAYEMLLKF